VIAITRVREDAHKNACVIRLAPWAASCRRFTALFIIFPRQFNMSHAGVPKSSGMRL
jgi:hypothetical protein